MKTTILIAIILVILYICYEYLRVQKAIRLSQKIVESTVGFENLTTDTFVSLLVLGDSTAVGVGSSLPSETLPALVAAHIGATYIENQAVSGARVSDLDA